MPGRTFLVECTHCLLIKHTGFKAPLYFYNEGWKQQEPKCITRNTDQDVKNEQV